MRVFLVFCVLYLMFHISAYGVTRGYMPRMSNFFGETEELVGRLQPDSCH